MKMKKKIVGLIILSLLMAFMIGCGVIMDTNDNTTQTGGNSSKESSIKYKDGIYEVNTPIDGEGFYTSATLTIKEGKIYNVDWTILDSYRSDRPFDASYERVYAGNSTYIEQCRSDWKGSRGYGPKLIETQDLGKVDVVTGATWTNKKFKEAMELALEKAKISN
jgi:major membrane immunogen (membrane-anchored lipoprotein)